MTAMMWAGDWAVGLGVLWYPFLLLKLRLAATLIHNMEGIVIDERYTVVAQCQRNSEKAKFRIMEAKILVVPSAPLNEVLNHNNSDSVEEKNAIFDAIGLFSWWSQTKKAMISAETNFF